MNTRGSILSIAGPYEILDQQLHLYYSYCLELKIGKNLMEMIGLKTHPEYHQIQAADDTCLVVTSSSFV